MTSSPAASSSSGQAASRCRAWWQLLAWVAICACLPVVVLRHKHAPGHAAKASQPAKKLTKDTSTDKLVSILKDVNSERGNVPQAIAALCAANPDYIGVGNSMIYTRLGLDPGPINELTGRKFFFLLHGSSATAAWYLELKNIIAVSGVKPKLVFFFFRDSELTSPLFHTANTYAIYINSIRNKEEPVLDSILAGGEEKQGLAAMTSRFLAGEQGIYNFAQWSEVATHRMTDVAMELGAPKVTKGALHDYLAERFSLDHVRRDVPVDLPPPGATLHDGGSSKNGEGSINQDLSFLPPMLEVADAHHLKLLFFRVKLRPGADGITPQTPDMEAYIKRLQLWLEQRGALFFDETHDPALTADIYSDAEHVNLEKRSWYTEYFWKRVAHLFPP